MGRWDRDKRFDDPQGRGSAPHRRPSEPLRRDDATRNRGERLCLVVNPRAGAGRLRHQIDDVRRAADRAFEQWDVRVTEGPGHAEILAGQAVDEGFDLVAAVGGDGTCHEVVNGFFDGDRPKSRKASFCVVPIGTGSDLVKTLRTPRTIESALWVAATGVTLPTDIGHVDFVTAEGTPAQRRFINVAGFGANGDVVRRANAMDKKWGGRVTFLKATIQSAYEYDPPRIALSWEGPDGPGEYDGTLLSVFVANGEYCGGGMWMGRGASMHDGSFDVTSLVPTPFAQQLIEVRHFYSGQVAERFTGARRWAISSLRASAPTAPEPVPIDLDGEGPGFLPATFRVLPRILPVRAGWRNPRL